MQPLPPLLTGRITRYTAQRLVHGCRQAGGSTNECWCTVDIFQYPDSLCVCVDLWVDGRGWYWNSPTQLLTTSVCHALDAQVEALGGIVSIYRLLDFSAMSSLLCCIYKPWQHQNCSSIVLLHCSNCWNVSLMLSHDS